LMASAYLDQVFRQILNPMISL